MRTGARAAAAYRVRPAVSPSSSIVVVLVLVLVLAFSSYDALGAEEVVNQPEVLRKFKSALANADPALADWNVNPRPPCERNIGHWRGVLCFEGHVYGLKLEGMKLAGRIDVDVLVPLRFLRTLSFMDNGFEGAMPDWKKLGALKSLYLSNNRFSGSVSDTAFTGMTSLKKVHLANNRITGMIPSSLKSPKLIELRLENNQFTGRIPEISFEHLKVMNVSNNQLEGSIPTALQKLDPSSFSGNKGLCGPPLDSTCSSEPGQWGGSKKSPVKIAIIAAGVLLGLLLLILLVVRLIQGDNKKQSPQLGRPEVSSYGKDNTTRATGVEATAAAAAAAAAPASASPAVTGAGKKSNNPNPGQAGKLTFVNDDRQKFDLQDLMRASAEVLGSGNFGASYKAVLVEGEAVVVKRFKQMNNIAKEDFHEHMRRLGRLKHPNLLPLVAYLYRKEEKLLVFDYVNNSSLSKHLHEKHSKDHPGLNWATRLKIIKGVAKGILYLHNELPSLSIPHAHLKSSNVLVDDDFNPLLMDYTLAPVVNPNQVHQILVAYKSPEYTNHYRVCKKTDTWCLGILIMEVLTGKYVIAQGCGHHAADLAGWIHAIVQEVRKDSSQAFDKEMGIISDNCRPEMEKLLNIGTACCEEDVDKRLDLEEAVKQIEQVQESS